jgi:signal transduction histidine kinase
MQMDEAFIEDVVDRAAALVADRGKEAFGALRDTTGPFVFMDTYVFVQRPDGTELVNAAQPSLEGKNLIDVRDLNGKYLVREYIDAAMKHGSAWVDYQWYKPGHNTPAQKHSYVRRVQFGKDTYIVGSGFYPADEKEKTSDVRQSSRNTIGRRTGERLVRRVPLPRPGRPALWEDRRLRKQGKTEAGE